MRYANIDHERDAMLYAGGSHDVMIDGFASYAAVQELPNAKLVL